MPLPRKFLKLLCENNAFSCKIFIWFKMHPVNRGKGACLESATVRYDAIYWDFWRPMLMPSISWTENWHTDNFCQGNVFVLIQKHNANPLLSEASRLRFERCNNSSTVCNRGRTFWILTFAYALFGKKCTDSNFHVICQICFDRTCYELFF